MSGPRHRKPVTLFFTMEGIRALTLNFVDAEAEATLKQKQLATFEELLLALKWAHHSCSAKWIE